jgi:hypothetical protein
LASSLIIGSAWPSGKDHHPTGEGNRIFPQPRRSDEAGEIGDDLCPPRVRVAADGELVLALTTPKAVQTGTRRMGGAGSVSGGESLE